MIRPTISINELNKIKQWTLVILHQQNYSDFKPSPTQPESLHRATVYSVEITL